MSKNRDRNLKGKYINGKWLGDRMACPFQVRIFSREWPQGVVLTAQSIERALELDLDLRWLCYELAPNEQCILRERLGVARNAWEMTRRDAMAHWKRGKEGQTAICRAYKRAVADALIEAVK